MSFKDIPIFNGRYKINKFGVVKNNHDKILKPFLSETGYQRISLMKDGKKLNYYVHYLSCNYLFKKSTGVFRIKS